METLIFTVSPHLQEIDTHQQSQDGHLIIFSWLTFITLLAFFTDCEKYEG